MIKPGQLYCYLAAFEISLNDNKFLNFCKASNEGFEIFEGLSLNTRISLVNLTKNKGTNK